MTPDITTHEGRAEIERVVMEAMGYQDGQLSAHIYVRAGEVGVAKRVWFRGEGDSLEVHPEGWLYTGDGMVSAKRHFAVTRHWRVRSWQGVGGTGYAVLQGDDGIEAAAFDCEQGEPVAVALVLYKAAQRAAVEDSYTQGRRAERERIVRLLRDQIRETPVGQYATSALSEAIRRIEEDGAPDRG